MPVVVPGGTGEARRLGVSWNALVQGCTRIRLLQSVNRRALPGLRRTRCAGGLSGSTGVKLRAGKVWLYNGGYALHGRHTDAGTRGTRCAYI